MPRYNQQETPQDRRLAELAAITQLYGAIAGPQERQAQERQRSAMEMLGLMMQAHTAQQAEAFRQQQLGVEQQHWQGEQDVARQGHEDLVAQRREAATMRSADEAERNRIHEEDVQGRADLGKYGHEQQFLAMTPDQQAQAAAAYPDVYGEPRARLHTAEVSREVGDPVKQALFDKAMAQGGMASVRQVPALLALHPDVIKGLASRMHGASGSWGQDSTATQTDNNPFGEEHGRTGLHDEHGAPLFYPPTTQVQLPPTFQSNQHKALLKYLSQLQ